MEKTAIKKQLKTELEEAEQTLEQLNAQLDEKPDVGLGTGSTGIASWEMALARREQTEQHISHLQAALDRLAAGTYGLCENCGTPIDPERLEILPTTRLCANCA